MTLIMDDSQIKTVEQIQVMLQSSQGVAFQGGAREDQYAWIEEVLDRFKYFSLSKKVKGVVKAYVRRWTSFSRAQVTRLVARQRTQGSLKVQTPARNHFPVKYTVMDKELLAQTDNAHGRLSGPATKRIFERQHDVYGDQRFERLKNISSAHIYNLRASRTYQFRAKTFARTQAVQVGIGIRRKPETQDQPGWIRVDTVHQGDPKGHKGVYHLNLVDAVLQWEIVACVEKISEQYLVPVLEEAIKKFPFRIVGFHTDNGSEYINALVAKLLNQLLIEQTKSRSGRTNDNALVEGKNGSVIRKHMGYWPMAQQHAPLIHEFYRDHFNEYLNFHRPCGFATVTVDEKGKRHKKYETYQTPYERLKSLNNASRHLREGVTFEALDRVAGRQTDNACAQMMQKAKEKLFQDLGRAERKSEYRIARTSKIPSMKVQPSRDRKQGGS